MKILHKLLDCKSLEISQENFYGAVSFSEVAGLHCSYCHFDIERTHYQLFGEYVPKTNCLKKRTREKIFFLEKSLVNQLLNKVAAL